MKKILSSLALMAGILATGCNRPVEISSDSLKHILVKTEAAQRYVRKYESICRDTLKLGNTPIKAFTIRYEDLLAAMGISSIDPDSVKHKHIRVYLGYDSTDHVHAGFKLLILPVDSAYTSGDDTSKWKGGYDVLLDSTGKPIKYGPGGKTTVTVTPYVLDLNAPCPNTCSVNSTVN